MTTTLYIWSPKKKEPLVESSNRIKLDKLVPINPPQPPAKIYKVPISLWFVDINQR